MTRTAPPKPLTPAEVVARLDQHIVGQGEAKRAVAVALRNRWRRLQLGEEMREDIVPKNILMIGPTGVGKTEIARRLAKLAGAPFLKVEASKFTEVGYVGRDVESMVRDLVAAAIQMVKAEEAEKVAEAARRAAEDRVLGRLYPASALTPEAREAHRRDLQDGKHDQEIVEIEVEERPVSPFQILSPQGGEDLEIQLQNMMQGIMGPRRTRREMPVREALRTIRRQEEERLLDLPAITRSALERAQSAGIIFIDELDKIAGREGRTGPDVSREGVQRDLLPIVEGTTVQTKHGPVKTDHILFVGAGAFHVSKPSDLIPELQGRFPIRVELQPLREADLVRILTEPKHSLLRQYQALLGTEGVPLEFTPDAVEAIARFAAEVNRRTEDIGARRLYTVLERLLEEVSFHAPDMNAVPVTVDAAYVDQRLKGLVEAVDPSHFIL
jgi:ATP-dependent HslUV protease ATP-binding subunit HslU